MGLLPKILHRLNQWRCVTTVAEGAVLIAVGHNVSGQLGAETGDIGEQLDAGPVDFHTDAVDAAPDAEAIL